MIELDLPLAPSQGLIARPPKPVLLVPMPALILLDVMMPGMDGFEVLRHLKAQTETAQIIGSGSERARAGFAG